jgi:lambda family phage portal protein
MTAGTVQHVDLAAAPFKPSRVLVDFAAAQEAKRRQQAAARDNARAMGEFRRHSRGNPARKALDTALADLPQPAFTRVSGERSHAAHPARAEVAERAFAAAHSDRLSAGWVVFNTGINADLEAALGALRARSRDWFMNTELGERYGNLVADNVVGAEPPRLQMRLRLPGSDQLDEVTNTAVEQAFADWCLPGHCEVTGRLSFGDVCRNVAEGTARDGEFLLRHVRDRALPFGYQLQLLDVDRIDTARNVAPSVAGTNGIRLGVEINPYGRAVAMWLTNGHPGDTGGGFGPSLVSDRVTMGDLLHGFVQRRPEQVRGYPWASAVLMGANSLHSFQQYAMVAARVGAAKMGFYTVNPDVAGEVETTWEQLRDATGELIQDVEAGMLEALPPGVDFKGWDPAYPHQAYPPFVKDAKRGIAAGVNVAEHNLTGDMTGVNYSSARIAELTERRHWRALQRWLVNSFVRPAFSQWLRMALATQSIVLPSGQPLTRSHAELLRAAEFQPPKWDWVDPQSDTSAAAMEMTYDMRSPYAIGNQMGIDLDETLRDKARLKARYEALGLPVPPWLGGGQPMTAPGTPKPAPAPAPAETAAAEPAGDAAQPTEATA